MGELSLSVESLFGLHSRIMQLTYLKTQTYRIPCRFQKQIMLYHDQREKAVKLLLSSNFD